MFLGPSRFPKLDSFVPLSKFEFEKPVDREGFGLNDTANHS
jgi:hypothetical protein